MNEDYPTETKHSYKEQIANIRRGYELNIQPIITDEDFHNEFFEKLDGLDLMLADASFRDIKQEINEQIRFIKPYDPCRLLHDEYVTILDDVKSKNYSNTMRTMQKDKQLAEKRSYRSNEN